MNTGMLWFDNDPKKSLALKVAEAAKYYYDKYGCVPNTCMVNPSMVGADTLISVITVKPLRSILPGHLWIGCEEANHGA